MFVLTDEMSIEAKFSIVSIISIPKWSVSERKREGLKEGKEGGRDRKEKLRMLTNLSPNILLHVTPIDIAHSFYVHQ